MRRRAIVKTHTKGILKSLRSPEPDVRLQQIRRRSVAAAGSMSKSALSIVAALALASLVLQISGFGSLALLRVLADAFTVNIGDTLRWSTPLILTGLGTAIAFRARVWNIGLDGQLYVGAVFGALVASWSARHLSPQIGVVAVLIASVLGGAIWALIPSLLRIVWGAPEIVTTIILVSIAQQLVSYMVRGPMKPADPALASTMSTVPIDSRMWLVQIFNGRPATVAFYLALVVAIVVGVYLSATTHGYEHRIYGQNASFSFYGGVNNRQVFIEIMLISGSLGGLAGGLELLGAFHRLQEGFNPALGFAGIAVALTANHNPFGIVIAAIFFGALRSAGQSLQLSTNAPSQFVDIVTAIVILMMTGHVVERWLAIIHRVLQKRLGGRNIQHVAEGAESQ
jgi:ABC-type uncharacterized transport system permease subunit